MLKGMRGIGWYRLGGWIVCDGWGNRWDSIEGVLGETPTGVRMRALDRDYFACYW